MAFEALSLIYSLAFDTFGLHRLWGPIAEKNTKMLTLQRYLGFTVKARLPDHYFLNGEWQDAVYVGLLEERYRKVTAPKLRALIGGKP